MPVIARTNRISALLVALLYLFCSTFGAVAHTDAPVHAPRTAPTTVGAVSPGADTGAQCFASNKRNCAACEWQAVSVTWTSTPQPHVESALLPLVSVQQVYSIYVVCLARFSSRAPPAA